LQTKTTMGRQTGRHVLKHRNTGGTVGKFLFQGQTGEGGGGGRGRLKKYMGEVSGKNVLTTSSVVHKKKKGDLSLEGKPGRRGQKPGLSELGAN